jgi:hypothetical protein
MSFVDGLDRQLPQPGGQAGCLRERQGGQYLAGRQSGDRAQTLQVGGQG